MTKSTMYTVAVLLALAHAASAQFVFTQTNIACARAHCTPELDDSQAGMITPTPSAGQQMTVLTQDTAASGSKAGLGVSTNGTNTIAATYASDENSLVLYDTSGNIRCSTSVFDATAFASVPIVDQAGNIIMADDKHLGLINSDCSVAALTPTPGGRPASPVLTANGAVVLSTLGGPISVYSAATGALIGSTFLKDPGSSQYYQTNNTACLGAGGNTIYVSTSLSRDPNNTGRLYALNIDPKNTASPITVKWYYTFGGGSGASPNCGTGIGTAYPTVVYFDGWHSAPGNVGGPTIYAVGDAGASGQLVWSTPASGQIKANMPKEGDGIWYFPSGGATTLTKLRMIDGSIEDTINVSGLLGKTLQARVRGVMLIAQDASGNSHLLVSLSAGTNTYVSDIDPRAKAVVWSAQAPSIGYGQDILVVDGNGRTRVAFTTSTAGLVTAGLK